MSQPRPEPKTKDARPCRGQTCTADIFFARSRMQGRPVPLDLVPIKAYTLEWVPDPSDEVHGGYYVADLVDTYRPHHASCPDVSAFRRKK